MVAYHVQGNLHPAQLKKEEKEGMEGERKGVRGSMEMGQAMKGEECGEQISPK